MKVVDGGCYYMLAPDGTVIDEVIQNYVPSAIPGEWGDYIKFKIDQNGKITNWFFKPDKFKDED